MTRRAGVLLHPTSLPGSSGIGELGPSARDFLQWLASSGHRIWQVLPLQPVDAHGCPYAAASSVAGEPLMLSLDDLVRDGWLLPSERPYAPASDRVDYGAVRHRKGPALIAAADRVRASVDLAAWADDDLVDYARFRVLQQLHGADFTAWPEALAHHDAEAVDEALQPHRDEVQRHLALQWLFEQQWLSLRTAANELGIELWGDVPYFVGLWSADVWRAPHLWRLDDQLRPTVQSGVPPDAFSPTGQLWGHPLYDEAAHAAEGYAWWLRRLERALQLHDRVRLDHFRGLAAVWEIEAGASDATGGRWVPGPGAALLSAVHRRWNDMPLLAEDLGIITPDVEALRDDYGLPGMAILQFAFGSLDHPYLPHPHRREQVVFTGTHDNDTLLGWQHTTTPEVADRARRYLGSDDAGLGWAICRAAWQSVADTAIVPMQDLLRLGGHARMNVPGVQQGNWSWRMGHGALNLALAGRLREQLALAGRLDVPSTVP
jgi:4-alpha-glucanotransferase